MNKNPFKKNKSKGFTLIEVMLSLGIMMLVIIMVYSAYNIAMRDVRVRQTTDLLDMVFNTTQYMTNTRTDFLIEESPTSTRSISIAEVINMRQSIDDFPSGSFVDFSNGILYHPFGGEVELTTSSSIPGAFDLAQITITEVPRNVCLRIMVRMAPMVYDMHTNGNLVGLGPEPNADDIGRSELRVDQASPLCQRENNIQFRVLKEINFANLRHRLFPFGPSMTPEESAFITPLFDRQQDALAAREAAQLAL